MDFLALCQKVVREGAIIGGHEDKPLSVVDQVGRMALVVGWVNDANTTIQSLWNDYNFRSREIDIQVAPSAEKASYPNIQRINDNGIYARDGSSRRKIHCIEWTAFRHLRSTEEIPSGTALPTHIAIDPAGDIHFYPICNRQFILRAECVMNPQVMTADTDEPWIPEGFHLAIVYRALMFFYDYDEAYERYQVAESRYMEWLDKLDGACLPSHDMHRTSTLETPLVVNTE